MTRYNRCGDFIIANYWEVGYIYWRGLLSVWAFMCWLKGMLSLSLAVRRPFGTVTAIQAHDRLRSARWLHVPLGERATLSLIGEVQHPQVVIHTIERPLSR